MRVLILTLIVAIIASDGISRAADPPVEDERLSIHTLVREDIFAGWRANNMERFERGAKNVDLLLEQRPDQKAPLLAWKGGIEMFRAVKALEAGDRETCDRLFEEARTTLAEARQLGPADGGVAAVAGGSYVLWADKLPEEYRAAAWEECYQCYKSLWDAQHAALEQLPLHIKGELLAGMVQSSQRTGRTEELDLYLTKTLDLLGDTQYGKMAQQWKDDPKVAETTNISCKYCHNPGRLGNVVARLK